MYASTVDTGAPEELVVEDAGTDARGEVVGTGEDATMVSDGSSTTLEEVVVAVKLELGVAVASVKNPVELGGQGHVVKLTYSNAVSVNVAV